MQYLVSLQVPRGVLWHCRLAETGAWLSAVLTSANLISIFVLQKLGAVLAEKEQMKASQGALLRQVLDTHDRNWSHMPRLCGNE